ncbi:MAG: 50S ribosomal protein L6 [Candidatus Kerfeldbacteria bacterium RIFCSPHIGHO2_12_FULL_48_17]|uniref:Large ribosomal subunit protein uL6 n=1 Tax=Candidatus Kerfeldbacteria bacterium RIFCSPHIGHO2_12_FULL_48_17 TaxID=1798542 RepID=A0A1G2B4Y5_9BACT|nr:MAG: 50S ribosomal protein L6 [Candidatus Kerfeldbacteria bacterium RIFCSPHIGHO2_12_FULL_48_17]
MSRIGRQRITLPDGVEAGLDGNILKVKGPKAELSQEVHPAVTVDIAGKEIKLTVKHPEEKSERSLWGLFGALVSNMITGVTKGFEKKLQINGVGYKAVLKGKVLEFSLGFSHPILFDVPEGVTAKVEKNIITIEGADKQIVGETAARIRNFRKPEPYKGKGIKYIDEHIIRKAGKQAKTAE